MAPEKLWLNLVSLQQNKRETVKHVDVTSSMNIYLQEKSDKGIVNSLIGQTVLVS